MLSLLFIISPNQDYYDDPQDHNLVDSSGVKLNLPLSVEMVVCPFKGKKP